MTNQQSASQRAARRVVVVGPCASGKSTLVQNLKNAGYDAYSCAQEHSVVSRLFLHLTPDVVVFLHVELEDVRRRRSSAWSETIYDDQLRRLAPAREAADLVLDTSVLSEADALEQAVAFLEGNSGENSF